MIRFGAWSTTLGLAALFGTVVALLLLLRPTHRVANRFLCGLLIVAVLRLMPYVLGYAGFYDAYPWLSFAPFDHGLAIGPLLYLYLMRLTSPALPQRWGLHFVPALVDGAYQLWAFSLPLTQKIAWNDHWHVAVFDPLERWASTLSLTLYLVASFRARQRYLDWLSTHVSDREEHRQPWMNVVLTALLVWLLTVVVVDVASRFGVVLSYYDRFPQYLVFAALLMWVGVEGWRYADHHFPPMVADPLVVPAASRDWREQGQRWEERIRVEGWWREPRLSLRDAARRLATNESYLSKAFNDGLRRNFNAVINGFRVEEVKARLLAGDRDLLDVALQAGFASKASFNRVFREHCGMSPSAWQASQNPEKASQFDI